MNIKLRDIKNIEAFFCDFDGVLTDNSVYTDSYGIESVKCSRADGLAIDALKKINKVTYIISSEKNKVVKSRASKLNIPILYDIKDKKKSLLKLAKKIKVDLKKSVYIGNDLNDYYAMQLCGLKICPKNSHEDIKRISNFVLKTEGGSGIMREVLEKKFKLDIKSILYK